MMGGVIHKQETYQNISEDESPGLAWAANHSKGTEWGTSTFERSGEGARVEIVPEDGYDQER